MLLFNNCLMLLETVSLFCFQVASKLEGTLRQYEK